MIKQVNYHIDVIVRVNELLKERAAELAGTPAIGDLQTQLQTKIDSIYPSLPATSGRLKGVTQMKTDRREILMKSMEKVSAGATSYATFHSNPDLKRLVYLTHRAIILAKSKELIGMALKLHSAVEPIKADLAPYAVTASEVEQLKANIAEFTAWVDKPKDAKSRRKEAIAKTSQIIREGMAIIYQLDIYIRVYAQTNHEVYNLYKKHRKVGYHRNPRTADIRTRLAPGELKAVYSAPYHGKTFVQVRNNGPSDVRFSLSNTDSTEGSKPVFLGKNKKRERLCATLAPEGDHLVIFNPGTLHADVKVWVRPEKAKE